MVEFKHIQLGIKEFLLVANNGSVYYKEGDSMKKLEPTLDKRVRKNNTHYYYRIHVKNKYFYMHKLIATAWIENPYNHKFTMHKDGNTLNNSISNLEWVNNSHDVMDNNRMIDTWAFYLSINRDELTEQNKWIYDYFIHGNELKIAELFQSQKLRAICKWKIYAKEGDRFESLYDDLYENILSKIKRGVLLPKYGEKHKNSLFNYCIKTLDWLCYDRKKQFYEIMNLNSKYLAIDDFID